MAFLPNCVQFFVDDVIMSFLRSLSAIITHKQGFGTPFQRETSKAPAHDVVIWVYRSLKQIEILLEIKLNITGVINNLENIQIMKMNSSQCIFFKICLIKY